MKESCITRALQRTAALSNRTVRKTFKGHKFYKSSDCPTFRLCQMERKPESGFLAKLVAPARRALEREGITTLTKLPKQ